jgi:hypothetical protein
VVATVGRKMTLHQGRRPERALRGHRAGSGGDRLPGPAAPAAGRPGDSGGRDPAFRGRRRHAHRPHHPHPLSGRHRAAAGRRGDRPGSGLSAAIKRCGSFRAPRTPALKVSLRALSGGEWLGDVSISHSGVHPGCVYPVSSTKPAGWPPGGSSATTLTPSCPSSD